jgi:hypothetical protein
VTTLLPDRAVKPAQRDFTSASSSPSAITLHHRTLQIHSILARRKPHLTTPQTPTFNMVFQTRKNRRGAKQKQPATSTKTTLTDFPDELLLHMLQYTSITEVLRLRETSTFFVNTCTEIMRDKLKVLYVHPSPSSVQRAINLCKKSDLCSEVEEICFLSKAPFWQDDQLIKLHQRQWTFHKPRDDTDRPVRTFGQSYQKLLSALARMECLQKVSFQESCGRPGFNMLSTQRIANWQDTLGHRRGHSKNISKERRAENALYATKFKLTPPMAFLFADVDALNAVLNSGINFTRLILSHELFGNPLPFDMTATGYPTFLHPPPRSILRPQILTHLDLTVTAYWKFCEWHIHCAELLSAAAATLLELRIGIRHSPRQDFGTEGSLGQLLADPKNRLKGPDFPRLQRLELHSPPEWGLRPAHPVSVMQQSLDVDRFLEYHCKGLRTLHLTDICMGGMLVNGGCDSMKDIQLPDDVAAREIEGLGENTRAWEILERVEDENELESFHRWYERQQALWSAGLNTT